MTAAAPTLPLLRFPSRLEWRIMLQRPAVLITAMVCATWVLTVLVGGIVYLAATGKGTEALVAAVVTPLVGALVAVLTRTRAVVDQVQALERAVVQSPNLTSPDR